MKRNRATKTLKDGITIYKHIITLKRGAYYSIEYPNGMRKSFFTLPEIMKLVNEYRK